MVGFDIIAICSVFYSNCYRHIITYGVTMAVGSRIELIVAVLANYAIA